MPSHPHVCPSNSASSAGVSTEGKILGGWFHVIINLQPLFLIRAMSSDQLEALKTPDSIGSPGSDGGAVEFWISGGGGAGFLSKRPSSGPYSQKTANLLEQWKVSPGMVSEDKKMALHERPRCVTWG